MGIYRFLNLFLYFEILILFLVLFLIITKRVRSFFSEKRDQKLRHEISQFVTDCLEKKKIVLKKFSSQFRDRKEINAPLIEEKNRSDLEDFSAAGIALNTCKGKSSRDERNFPSRSVAVIFLRPLILLEVLEDYNRRLNGADWEAIKLSLSKEFLLPKMRNWVKSWFWIKRNFAARALALTPLPQDEPYILYLIDDSSFLVRSIAATAAVRLESEKGVIKTLRNMSREPGYAHYYYSDILSQGSTQVFSWVAEAAAKRDDLHLACLEVLAAKVAPVPTPFLEQDFKASNSSVRQAALRVAIRNPQKGSVEIFSNCLKDPDEQIRKLGGSGLGNYSVEESYEALLKGAADPSWKVRLECAKSLKKLGKIELLKDEKMIKYVTDYD